MHFLAEFTLLSLSIIFVQGRFVPEIKNLNDVISSLQAEQFLSPDKLQQLQNGFFATALTGLNNQWDVATLAQALQQFVTQYIPQVVQMRIDWEVVAQSAFNDVATALSNILIDTTGGLVGKRDLSPNDLQLLAQLPLDKLAQIVDVVNIPDRPIALGKLRQLLQQSFPVYQGRDGFDDIADDLLNQLNNLLPHFNQQNSPIQD